MSCPGGWQWTGLPLGCGQRAPGSQGSWGACQLLPGLPHVAVCSAEEEARTLEEKWRRGRRSCPRLCPALGDRPQPNPSQR